VEFLIGGTQTNFVAIAAFLRPWESVICAEWTFSSRMTEYT
jgi:threonine aldolase